MEVVAIFFAIACVVLLVILLVRSRKEPTPPPVHVDPTPLPRTPDGVVCTIIGSVSAGKTLMLCSVAKALRSGGTNQRKFSAGIAARLQEIDRSGKPDATARDPEFPLEWLETRHQNQPLRIQAIAGEDLYNSKGEMSAPDLLARYDGPGKMILVAANPFLIDRKLAEDGVRGLTRASLEKQQSLGQAVRQAARIAFSMSKLPDKLAGKLDAIDSRVQRSDLGLDQDDYVTSNGVSTGISVGPIFEDLVDIACGERIGIHMDVLRDVIAHARFPCVAMTHVDLKRFSPEIDGTQFLAAGKALFGARTYFATQLIVEKAIAMTAEFDASGFDFRIELQPEMGAGILTACAQANG
jgi:hypothetical protein